MKNLNIKITMGLLIGVFGTMAGAQANSRLPNVGNSSVVSRDGISLPNPNGEKIQSLMEPKSQNETQEIGRRLQDTQRSEIQARRGGIHGGGGSQEARTFAHVARLQATYFLHIPKYKKLAEQILDTLGTVEIHMVSRLSDVCTHLSPESADSSLYARSCNNEIYLLDKYWSESYRGYLPSGPVFYGERWLMSESRAKERIKDIFHEIFRAGDPTSKSYVTNDNGYSVTSSMFSNINPHNSQLSSNCDVLNSICSLPFDDEILDVVYLCSSGVNGRNSLYAKVIGGSGLERRFQIGGMLPNDEYCQQKAKKLSGSDYTKTLIGKSYYCSPGAYGDRASLYMIVIRPDLSHFTTSLAEQLPVSECLQRAEQQLK